jgi:hypothetical protein
MGEEKPDEELMGKRKSSPRLSPDTSRRRYYHCDPGRRKYTLQLKKMWRAHGMLMLRVSVLLQNKRLW